MPRTLTAVLFLLAATPHLAATPQGGDKKADPKKGKFDANVWKVGFDLIPPDSPFALRNRHRFGTNAEARAHRDWLAKHRIDEALRWLKRVQSADGSYGGGEAEGSSPVHDVGLTGLAMLAFLGDGSTLRSGPYKAEIKKATTWLRSHQRPDGLFSTAASNDSLLEHTIATYAMTETHGLSAYKVLKKNATRGAAYASKQTDVDVETLGWQLLLHHTLPRFRLDDLGPHLEATGTSALRRKAGPDAKFLRQPVSMLHQILRPGAPPRLAATGDKPRTGTPDTAMLLATAGKDPATSEETDAYWYFSTLAMRAHGGDHAKQWQKVLEAAIERAHHEDGSWGPHAPTRGRVGKIYSTVMMLLLLQSRFDGRLPQPKTQPGKTQPKKK